MSKKTKAFIYNTLGFAILFISFRYAILPRIGLTGYALPIVAFLIGTFTAPKFQGVTTADGEKLFFKWIFMKGVREVE